MRYALVTLTGDKTSQYGTRNGGRVTATANDTTPLREARRELGGTVVDGMHTRWEHLIVNTETGRIIR